MPYEKPTPKELEARFRGHGHPLTGQQAERATQVRETVLKAAKALVKLTPCCAEQTRALNLLDDAVFLACAAIERHPEEAV